MSKIIIIGNSNAGSETAIKAINHLKNHGHEVVILKKGKDMNLDFI